MFENISIIGCGLIGSSILRAIDKKKISKNINIFDKSKETLSFSMDRVYYIKKVALFVNLQTDLRTVQLVQQLGRK